MPDDALSGRIRSTVDELIHDGLVEERMRADGLHGLFLCTDGAPDRLQWSAHIVLRSTSDRLSSHHRDPTGQDPHADAVTIGESLR